MLETREFQKKRAGTENRVRSGAAHACITLRLQDPKTGGPKLMRCSRDGQERCRGVLFRFFALLVGIIPPVHTRTKFPVCSHVTRLSIRVQTMGLLGAEGNRRRRHQQQLVLAFR